MLQQKFTLPSHNGEDTIRCYLDLPQGNPKAVLQIVHGMCEFYERYRDFINWLVARGFAVCGHDHVGHGDSIRDKDHFGYFAEKNGHRVLTQDAHAVSVYVKDRLPIGTPFILMGHSMGSFVARDYLSRFGKELDGAVIMGTSGPNPAASAGIALARSVCALRGSMYRPRMIQNIAFGGYTARIENALTGYEWLSRDPEIIEKYAGDERCTFIFTAGGFADLFTLLRRVNGKKWGASVSKDLPVLLISGSEDPVGNYGKGVRQVNEMLKKAGHNKTEMVLYPEMRHEILNEVGKEQVYDDLLAWVEKTLAK